MNEWLRANHIYEKLFFEESHESLLSKAEGLLKFMLESGTVTHEEIVKMVTRFSNPKMMSLMRSALSRDEFSLPATTFIANVLIDIAGANNAYKSEVDSLLLLAMEKSKSDPTVRARYIDASIKSASGPKANPTQIRTAPADFAKVLSLEGLCDEK